jgi:DNA-binding response OmpR family regulator
MGNSTLSFGPFLCDPVTGSLWREGKSVAIGPRPTALLGMLLEVEGRVVTKADLMERAWPGPAVEEGNLTVQIATLRKLLGPKPDGTEWIVTVRGSVIACRARTMPGWRRWRRSRLLSRFFPSPISVVMPTRIILPMAW